MQKVSKNVFYVGVNDHEIDLFEGHYDVPNGMAYNSYVIMDEKTVVMDSVGEDFFDEWNRNIKEVLGDKSPDYIVVQHMEPDHSKNLEKFINEYPNVIVVASMQAFKMMGQFFPNLEIKNKLVVKENDVLLLK